MSELIEYTLEGRVASVRINRPDAGNALTTPMMMRLGQVLMSATLQSDVIVFSGAGEDFCLGREVDSPPGLSHAERIAPIGDVNLMLGRYDGIVLSAIRGRAMGFASGLAVLSDIAIASEGATFGFDEIRKGFPPLIVSSYLQDHLLRKHVVDLLLSGRDVSAAEAARIGMVTRLVPDAELEAATEETLEALRGTEAAALRRLKSYLGEIQAVPRAERGAYALRAQAAWFAKDH